MKRSALSELRMICSGVRRRAMRGLGQGAEVLKRTALMWRPRRRRARMEGTMRTLAIAGLLAVTTAVLVLGVIVAVDRSAPSIGGVALDAQAEDPGEPDCDALADRALIGLLDYMEQVVDPVTALPAVDPPLELAAEDLPPGCDPVEVRRITYERLLPAAVERFGEEGLAARTTVLSTITSAPQTKEVGMGATKPRPIP
ncbi:MAG: hypothetical protein ACR2HR_15660, partial [Euzebya sp.]